MKIHHFEDSDLRTLASLAVDICTDHLEFKVFRIVLPKENYWSIDCRFAVSQDEMETWYDSLHINSGRDNEPETYQMSSTVKKNDFFNIKPITSPLVVVAYFQEMCKKETVLMN